MQVQPYVCFEGRCEEAIEFYKKALGAEVVFQMRFKEMPGPHPPGAIPPGAEDKIMHASLKIGEASLLMSDGRVTGKPDFQGVSLALQVRDAAQAERAFAGLADGGQVQMSLTETFWSPRFGIVADRFGVSWMVNVATAN
jgi:PhnB protein